MPIKIGLVTPHTHSHRTPEETIALGYLAIILRNAGYEVCIVDGWLERLSVEEVVRKLMVGGSPQLVGFSCYRSNLEQASEVLALIKERIGDIPTICGGYGPTFSEEDYLDAGFTVAVRGEAEHMITSLVSRLLQSSDLSGLPGISYRDGAETVRTVQAEPVNDLDLLPFPARDTVRQAIQQRNFVHMVTSRGCAGHCTFCSIIAFAKNGSRNQPWRHRSIRNIIDEIRHLYETHGVTHYKFVDDSFLEHPRAEKWCDAFRSEMETYHLPIRFRTQVRADRLTPQIVKSLSECGWFATSVGVENMAPSALRRMAKSASVTENQDAIDLLAHHKVYVQMGLILFDPDTTMRELWENCGFLSKQYWPVHKGIFTEMYAAEGTPFTKKLKKQGIISETADNQNYSYPIKDAMVRRAYSMLKKWHRSHSTIFDWAIDSLTAPKVLPDHGYSKVHTVCQKLLQLDAVYFRAALSHIEATANAKLDTDFVESFIAKSMPEYERIKQKLGRLYSHYNLEYNAVANPFLTNC